MADPKTKQGTEPESYLEAPTAKPAEKEKSVFSGLRVSLMPAELAGSAAMDPRKALTILAVVLTAELFIMGLAYLAVIKVSNDRRTAQEALRTELTTLQSQTPALEEQAKKASQFSTQYEANQLTLNEHVYWTAFFVTLEKYILPSVQCSSFSGDFQTGVVNMDCHGRNYRDVAEQIVYMRTNPLVSDFKTGAASAEIDTDGNIVGTSFSMRLQYDKKAWQASKRGDFPSVMPEDAGTTGSEANPALNLKAGSAPIPLETLTPATAAANP